MRGKRDPFTAGVTSAKSQRRRLTKKLQGIVLQLKARPEADAFLLPVDESEVQDYRDHVQQPMDLSSIEGKIADYATPNELLEDVQLMYNNCVAYNGRKHALTKDCKVLVDECKRLLAELEQDLQQEEDEEEEQAPRAQSTPSSKAAAKAPSKKSTPKAKDAAQPASPPPPQASTGLDSAAKTKLRQVVSALMDDPRAPPFSIPISDKDVPGYSLIISEPMDLSTLKKNIKNYTQMDEFVQDFTSIWANCRQFNLETAPVVTTANELEALGWQLLSDAFPDLPLPASQAAGRSSGTGKEKSTSRPKSATQSEEAAVAEPGEGKASRSQKRSRNSMAVASSSELPQPQPSAAKKRGRPSNAAIEPAADAPTEATAMDIAEEEDASQKRKGRPSKSTPAKQASKASARKSPTTVLEDEDEATATMADQEQDQQARARKKQGAKASSDSSSATAKSRPQKEKPPEPRRTSKEGSGKRAVEPSADDEEHPARRRGRPRKNSQSAAGSSPPTTTKAKSTSVQAKMKQILDLIKEDPRSGPFMQPVSESEAPGYHDIIDQPNDLSTMTKNLPRYGDDVNSFKEDMQLIWNNCMVYNNPDSEIWRWAEALSDRFEQLCKTILDQPEKEGVASDKSAAASIRQLFDDLKSHELAGPFQYPVDDAIAPGYSALIAHPMDMSTIEKKLPSYGADVEAFAQDVRLMFDNCRQYNLPESEIYQTADELSSWFERRLAKLLRASSSASSSSKVAKPKKPKQQAVKEEEVGHRAAKAAKLFTAADRDLSELEKTAMLIEGADGIFAQPVREAAHLRSQAFLKTLQFPWQFEGFRVISLGKVRTAAAFHTRNYIFPVGFHSEKDLHLRITSPDSPTKLLPVTFSNRIVEHNGRPQFDITIANDVLVASSSHPLLAWESVLQNKQAIMLALGARLRRCRAVLNRLATDPQIMPFIEKIRPSEASAYYDIVKSPMWLREVHARIVRGDYDSEFEFAEDVRLVWENCKAYNKEGSGLWEIADRLQQEFEQLFCDWVLNVQDQSITDLARGPWDDWIYLRYFDGTEADVNMCRITGERRDESELLFCCSCEDQYLPSALDEPASAGRLQDWKCPRCVAAERGDDRAGAEPEYRAARQWKPDLETSVGWMKTTDKALWLSPFGAEVKNAADLAAAVEAATVQHEERKNARAAEFAAQTRRRRRRPEAASGEDTAAKTSGRSRRRVDWRPSQNESLQAATYGTCTRLEDGSIVLKRSSLPTLQIRPQDRLELVCDIGFEGAEPWVVEAEYFPECGFFGLDSDDIRRAIEGLSKAAACENYEFESARDIRDQMLEDIEATKARQHALEEGNRELLDSLTSERWQFKRRAERARKRMRETVPGQEPATGLLVPGHSLPLFSGMANDEIECVLMIWEFINAAAELLGDVKLSLEEITLAAVFRPPEDPSGLELPSLAQLYYDELSVTLVKLLLSELRNVTSARSDKDWAQLLALKPLNILTWPELARQCLCILTQYRLNDAYNSTDVIRTLRTAVPPHLQRCEDIFCLLMIHPLIEPFMRPVDPALVPDYLQVIEHPMDLSQIRRKMSSYESADQFVADVRLLWQNARIFNPPLSPIANSARLLSTFFERLVKKWLPRIQQQQQLPVAEDSARSVTTSHPAFWADTVAKSGGDQENAQHAANVAGAALCTDVRSANPAVLGYFAAPSETELFDASLLRDMEAALDTLRSTDPERWSRQLRMKVLDLLVQECVQTITFRRFLSSRIPNADRDEELPDIADDLPEADVNNLQSVRRSAQHVCFVSGLQSRDVPEERWVAVPPEYQQNLTSSQEERAAQPQPQPAKKSQVALDHCMRQLITARQLAVSEEEQLKQQLDQQINSWARGELGSATSATTTAATDVLLRTQPLGHDRAGNEYWKFTAMDTGFTAAIGTEGRPGKLAPVPATLRDSLLVHQPTGVWKYYKGRNDMLLLLAALDSTHSCDQLLRTRIVEAVRLDATSLPASATPWVKHRQAQIDWVHIFTPDVLHEMATVDAVKFIETLWARCIESRMSVHMWTAHESLPHKPQKASDSENMKEINKEKRKAREHLIQETMDFHPEHGWLRTGAFDSIKELSASTTATKLLTDHAVASVTSQFLSHSKLRKAGSLGSSLTLGVEHAVEASRPASASAATPAPAVSAPKVEPTSTAEQAAEEEPGSAEVQKRSTRSRPVDQIDPATGRIVKRWSSGNEAATTLEISQGGISLCCRGVKREAYGFRWRLASETPADADIQELDVQTLRSMLDRRRGGRSKSAGSSSAAAAAAASTEGGSAQPLEEGGKEAAKPAEAALPKPSLEVSVVLVSPRLAKLKAELLNVAFVIPTHRLIWDVNAALELNDEEDESNGEVAVQRFLEWVVAVQQAFTAQQLLDLVLAFEAVIPKDYFHSYYLPKAFPTRTTTCAGVACRLFALDRALRYEDASKFDWRASSAPYHPRIELYPRCVQTATCSKPFCHWGRCNTAAGDFSRLPELVAAPIRRWPVPHAEAAPMTLPRLASQGLEMLPQLLPEPKRRRQSAPVRPPSPEPVLPDPSEIVASAWI